MPNGSNGRGGSRNSVEWLGSKIPPWLLYALAVLGAPSSAGLAIWNQNAELKMARIEDHLVYIDRTRHQEREEIRETMADIRLEVAQRVRIDQRSEMMSEYERRFRAIEAHINRLEDRMLSTGPGGPYDRFRDDDQRWWEVPEVPDPPRTDPREGYGDP